jgi:hypothetical protein
MSASRLLIPALLVAVAVAGVGCVPVVAFDVPLSAETTVEGGGLIEQFLDAFGFGDFANIDVSTTDEFENNDVRREQVTSAKLTALSLTIAAPQGADFDWLDEIAFSVEADGEPDVEVASGVVADDTVAATLDLEDVELAPYVRAPAFAITTDVTARRPPQDTTVRVDLVFSIAAELR